MMFASNVLVVALCQNSVSIKTNILAILYVIEK